MTRPLGEAKKGLLEQEEQGSEAHQVPLELLQLSNKKNVEWWEEQLVSQEISSLEALKISLFLVKLLIMH